MSLKRFYQFMYIAPSNIRYLECFLKSVNVLSLGMAHLLRCCLTGSLRNSCAL